MIECKKSTVRLIDDNILFIDVCENQDFSMRDFNEIRIASIRLANKKNVYNLINLGDKTIPDAEAREACSKEVGDGCVKAEAIIIYSLGQRIVARDIVKNKKKHIPIKLFTNLEKAKLWLQKTKKELEQSTKLN